MPEHLRALVVIVTLATALFFAAKRPCLQFTDRVEFNRWRNLWLALTVLAFLCQNFWLYVLAASAVTLLLSSQYKNKAALFFLLLFIIPPASAIVPGFGLVNYIFQLNHPRLMALLLLLPCFLTTKRSVVSGGRISDGLFLCYVLLAVALQLRQTSITDTARFSFHILLDTALPYYVFSRSLKDIQAFRQTFLCLVLACMIISLIAMFEFSKHWLLYSTITDVLGIGYEGNYLARADLLRASGPSGNPIVLGYLMMVSTGLYLFLMNSVGSTWRRYMGLVLLFGGLIASLSRGPWLGTVLLICVFVATGREPIRRLTGLGIAGILALVAFTIIPGGNKVLDLLPYIGTVEVQNIEYRERLIDNALIVIQRNFWFGSVDYLETPEMQEMRQGAGSTIDVVNSYVRIALSSGIFGLILFVSFFASTITGVWRAMAAISSHSADEHILGRSLFASAIAVLFTIATVSSIMTIPIIYWSIAGMSVAYARMIRNLNVTESFSNIEIAAETQLR